MSGGAFAFQQPTVPTEEPAEVATAADEADAVEQPAPEASEAVEAEVSDEDNYRAAVKSYSKCRATARREGGAASAAGACNSQRKRMVTAKEALTKSR
jgi:hypothetical protein